MEKKIEAKQLLVFNSFKKLIGIFYSVKSVADMLGASPQSIHYACTGKCIACKGFYIRHLSDDIEIELQDLGILRLTEYDKMCGVERKLYPNSKMQRTGTKYNIKKEL